MKKIVLTLAAIAALSTAAYADKRTADLRDVQPFQNSTGPVAGNVALKAAGDIGGLTAYERLIMQQKFNEIGGN